MRLVAKIERFKQHNGRPALRCTFPQDRKPFMYERVLNRNLGPRPYGEGSFVNKQGEHVVIYFK